MTPSCLFVYGTLRRGAGHPMQTVLSARATFAGDASVEGRLYDLGAFPGAVPSDDGRVFGELWELREPADTLATLDDYEGCGPNDDEPHLFRRAVTEARRADGGAARAWIYWYAASPDGCRIGSGDWLARPEAAAEAPRGRSEA